MIYFNLLPHREAMHALQRDQFNKSMILAAILACVTAFAIYGAVSSSLDSQKQNQDTLEQEIKQYEKQIIEIKDLESQIASLLARQKAVEDIEKHATRRGHYQALAKRSGHNHGGYCQVQ